MFYRKWEALLVSLTLVVVTLAANRTRHGGAHDGSGAQQGFFSQWLRGIRHSFTKEKLSALITDLGQFIHITNVIVLGPYYRALYSSWVKFTYRLARYINFTARTVHTLQLGFEALRQQAQQKHAKVLSSTLAGLQRVPASRTILRTDRQVELFLLYSYSALVALLVASIIHACTHGLRGRRGLRVPTSMH